ncbi:MAG TPA: OPT/YSL family transporter, partial [Kofleriaceae bacterium]|nr:OPT/YSL family transporter [Kofleriaceae bacterium]
LDMPIWMTLTAIALSLPLMLVGLRVLGETNWGPISALSNMMQGVFAAIAPGNVAANMVASGTTGTIATSSEAIMQDYRCGHIIGTKPRNITVMQLLAVPIGAAAVSWMYPVLVQSYHIFDTTDPVTGKLIKAQLTSPISNKWAGFAQILKDGVSALPTSALYALVIFSVLGVVLTVLELRPSWKKYVPSPTGIGLCIVQRTLLDMPVWMTLAAMVLSLPLMLVGLRVLGETNWGPISAVSNMMQGVFALLAPGNIAANMVASGTTGTIAESSQSIMQDYKCGHIIGSKPRNITIMQLMAVPIGAAGVSWMYPVLVKSYGLYDITDPVTGKVTKALLTSPISNKWAGFAQILQDGVSALPTSALWALLICSVLGVVLTIVEARPGWRRFVPSATGVGMGIIVPFSVVITMFLGGIAGLIWERRGKASADVYLIPLASGLIAGEALVAVFAAIFLATIGG